MHTEQHSLITKTKKQWSEHTVRGFENIDLFYDIFTNRQKSKCFYEKTTNGGIKSIKVGIYPPFKIKIPIEVIFKFGTCNSINPINQIQSTITTREYIQVVCR